MAKYSVLMQRTLSTTAGLGPGVITADATRPRRNKIYDIVFGAEGTPADAAILLQGQRCTAAGTSTAVTPQSLDPADAATETDAGSNITVTPTLTANAFALSIALNQRATFRWVAAPGGEIVLPATASNGLAFVTPTAPAVAATLTCHFEEQ